MQNSRIQTVAVHPRRFLPAFAVLCAMMLAAVILQVSAGAYQGEFGGHEDEAGHFITGLMIRDYVVHGYSGSPMAYAKNFYLHYPKVALGHWPPVFYLIQLPWMLALPPSHGSLMALMALLSALVATTIAMILKRHYSWPVACAGGILFLVFPVSRTYGSLLMADMLTALLSLWAVCCWGWFLDTKRARYALGFGALAALAILTKGSAFFLALVPPLTILFTQRWSLLKAPAVWLAALLVGVLCGPWYALTFKLMKNGFENPQDISSTLEAIPFYASSIVQILGPGLMVLALVGFAYRAIRERAPDSGVWVATGALMVCVPIFHCIVTNAFDNRYLLPMLPATVLFAIAGVSAFAQGLHATSAMTPRGIKIFMALFLACSVGIAVQRPVRGPSAGFGAVADRVCAGDAAAAQSVVLVSSDARGEGMAVAQIALRDNRESGHYVLRSSKMLASSLWDGRQYDARFQTGAEVLSFLDEAAVMWVIDDRSMPGNAVRPHTRLLSVTVRDCPEKWRLQGEWPVVRDGDAGRGDVFLYRRVGAGSVDKATAERIISTQLNRL